MRGVQGAGGTPPRGPWLPGTVQQLDQEPLTGRSRLPRRGRGFWALASCPWGRGPPSGSETGGRRRGTERGSPRASSPSPGAHPATSSCRPGGGVGDTAVCDPTFRAPGFPAARPGLPAAASEVVVLRRVRGLYRAQRQECFTRTQSVLLDENAKNRAIRSFICENLTLSFPRLLESRIRTPSHKESRIRTRGLFPLW